MAGDLPTINYSNYASNSINCADLGLWQTQVDNAYVPASQTIIRPLKQRENKEMAKEKDQTRIVRVIIADPDSRIPVEKRVLSSTDERVTDATDQELFYELDVKPLLDKHNAYRTTVADKEATQKLGKEVMLEPVRIRDLVMTVVCVAQF